MRQKQHRRQSKDMSSFLKNMKGYTPRDFRLGKAFYEDKFKYDIQSSLTAAETYQAALNTQDLPAREMVKDQPDALEKIFWLRKPAPIDTLELIRKDDRRAFHQTCNTAKRKGQSAMKNSCLEPRSALSGKRTFCVYRAPPNPGMVRETCAYMATG